MIVIQQNNVIQKGKLDTKTSVSHAKDNISLIGQYNNHHILCDYYTVTGKVKIKIIRIMKQ